MKTLSMPVLKNPFELNLEIKRTGFPWKLRKGLLAYAATTDLDGGATAASVIEGRFASLTNVS